MDRRRKRPERTEREGEWWIKEWFQVLTRDSPPKLEQNHAIFIHIKIQLFWLLREKPRSTEVASLQIRQAFSLIQKQYPTSSTNWLV